MKPSKSQAKGRIQTASDEIPGLKQVTQDSQDFLKWRRNAQMAIFNTFEKDNGHLEEFDRISYRSGVAYVGAPEKNRVLAEEAFLQGLNEAEALLQSMIEEIEEYWPEESAATSTPQTVVPNQPLDSKQVFVVHGRDDGAKQTVARFLESLELKPIILQEQPNAGRTIIEKFEEYSQVGFVVILCTPDDVGALATEPDQLRSRPRQNVVLEWGFFLGKIGRERVCALVKGGVEIPSDYSGVVYIEMDDSNGWQLQLVKELYNAGLPVDANRLLRK